MEGLAVVYILSMESLRLTLLFGRYILLLSLDSIRECAESVTDGHKKLVALFKEDRWLVACADTRRSAGQDDCAFLESAPLNWISSPSLDATGALPWRDIQ